MYTKTNWTETTPRSLANLNKMETQYDEAIADAVALRADNTEEIRIFSSATFPPSPTEGFLFYHTGFKNVFVYNGTDWIELKSKAMGYWTELTPQPVRMAQGANLVFTGVDDMYIVQSGNSLVHYKYKISTDTWTLLNNIAIGGTEYRPNFCDTAYGGGNFIYLLRGNDSIHFLRYSIDTDSWSLLANVPGAVRQGSALVYTGGDYLYALRGNTTSDFYRYSISGNSWTAMASLPTTPGGGARLVYDGGNYIFATRGGNTTSFYRYSISGNTWASMESSLGTMDEGCSLACFGTPTIYATRGNLTTDFYKYLIDENKWIKSIFLPTNFQTGGSITATPIEGKFIFASSYAGSSIGEKFYYMPLVSAPTLVISDHEAWMK